MKKFETLPELPKCNTDKRYQSKQMLLEKWCQETCLTQVCHKPSMGKNAVSTKHNKVKHNKMRYACMSFKYMNGFGG